MDRQEGEGEDVAGLGLPHQLQRQLGLNNRIAFLRAELQELEDESKNLERGEEASRDWSTERRRARSKFYSQLWQLKYKLVLAAGLLVIAAFQLTTLLAGHLISDDGARELLAKVFKRLNVTLE